MTKFTRFPFPAAWKNYIIEKNVCDVCKNTCLTKFLGYVWHALSD